MTEDEIRREDEELGFERQDLSPKGIYGFLIALAIATALLVLVLKGVYGYMVAYEEKHQPAQNPLLQQTSKLSPSVSPKDIEKFPQPRLENNERTEINAFRLKEEKTLNTYGWVDQNAGVVHIPIDRAMQMVVQRGLPVRAQQPPQPSAAGKKQPGPRGGVPKTPTGTTAVPH